MCLDINFVNRNLKFYLYIFCQCRKQLEKGSLLDKFSTFEAVGINHNSQADGISCGIHVIEV